MKSYQIHTITYSQYKDGSIFSQWDDSLNVLAVEFEPKRRVLLANPNLTDMDSVCVTIGVVDNVIVARNFAFPNRIKIDNDILAGCTGTDFFVYQDHRGVLGADMFAKHYIHDVHPIVTLAGGLSHMAVPLHKRVRNLMLPMQRYYLRYNIRAHFRQNGKLKLHHKLISSIYGMVMKSRLAINARQQHRKIKGYSVERVDTVPDWVTDMVLNDGHRFMEVHDAKWLQWNLDYTTKTGERNKQFFYTIKKNGEPVGFFMTKERMRVDDKNGRVMGSIVEWGSRDEKELGEADICRMAIKTFGLDVYIIQHATVNPEVENIIQRWGFRFGSIEYFSFRDHKKQFPETKDVSQWRLRFGACDTIFC